MAFNSKILKSDSSSMVLGECAGGSAIDIANQHLPPAIDGTIEMLSPSATAVASFCK